MEAILTAKPSFPSLKEKEWTIFGSGKESSSPKYVAPPVERNSSNTPHSPRKTTIGQAELDSTGGHVGTSSGPGNINSGLNGWDKVLTQHPQYQG